MNKKRQEELQEFCQSLKIEMRQWELLDTALTHTSYAYEAKQQPRPEHNERLEFLGDSVLSVIVSGFIYIKYPEMDEGNMSKLRAFLVCESSLAVVARKINLGKYLLLGHGEMNLEGRDRPSILADAFESFIAAYFMDQGFFATQKLLYELFLKDVDGLYEQAMKIDYKTRLQEEVQKNGAVEIAYELLSTEGPAHNRLFSVRVTVDGKEIGRGSGKSKKEAEQQAAKAALSQKTSE